MSDNENRAELALRALQTFAGKSAIATVNDLGDEPQAVLCDLLADLRHLCAREGLDFDGAVYDSEEDFDVENAEDPWPEVDDDDETELGEIPECCGKQVGDGSDDCPGTCDHCGFSRCPEQFDVYQCDGHPQYGVPRIGEEVGDAGLLVFVG